jgi:hypothetical protein
MLFAGTADQQAKRSQPAARAATRNTSRESPRAEAARSLEIEQAQRERLSSVVESGFVQ